MGMKKHTHIGVYGIVDYCGKTLLVQKQRGPYTGKWDLPGGGVESGENSIETLERELQEECGYQVKKAELVDVLNNVAGNGLYAFHPFQADVV